MTDINSFIHGGAKVPSAKFEAIGDKVVGTVTGFDVSQTRDFKTNDPEFWPDGKPKEQLVITLQTDERDSSIDDDDGLRRVFAKKPGNLLTAIADALTEAKAEIAIGGRLAVVFTGQKPHENPKFNPIKEYKAAYEPPAQGQANDLLAGVGSATQQAPATDPSSLL